ncbi:TorF family putative porin [Parasphingorhabdus sp.]|uniref:TorF family putative porin n=1 Tax=Parasphingorhabdus sp. TaxID=2709688 RepID=UPI003C718CB7
MRTSNLNNLGKKAKSQLVGLSAILLATTAAPAFAQDAEAPSSITVSGNAAITSDYRFRGVSFSDGDIAVQGGIDVAHESGFYVGTWASSIEDSATFGHTELDIYGGWSGEVSSGVTVDVGLLYYIYPNGEGGLAGPSDYFEPYASISGTLGPVEATLGAAYAFDQAAIGNDDNIYVYTDFSTGIPSTPISLNAHLGYTDGTLSTAVDGDNFDWSVGADWAVTGNLTAGLKYVGVGGVKVDDFTDDTVVFTLGVAF